MNRKHVPTDSNVLRQKTWSLYEDFSKGSPETSDFSHLLQVRDGYKDLGIGSD